MSLIGDIGTHSSLIQLKNGKFVLLDAVDMTDAAKAELDIATDNGKKIVAVIMCHSFHTLHIMVLSPFLNKLYRSLI